MIIPEIWARAVGCKMSLSDETNGRMSILTGFLARQPFLVFAVYTAIGALSLTALSWQHSKEIR